MLQDTSLPQSTAQSIFKVWKDKKVTKYVQLFNFDQKRIKTFEEVGGEMNIPSAHYLICLQIRTHLKSKTKDLAKAFAHTIINKLTQKTYAIIDIFPSLSRIFYKRAGHRPEKGWKKDFPGENMENNFLKGYYKISRLAINESWRETQFKILHRAYIPFLHIPDQSKKVKCPKCLMDRPTLQHKLWSCPKVRKFWDQVLPILPSPKMQVLCSSTVRRKRGQAPRGSIWASS